MIDSIRYFSTDRVIENLKSYLNNGIENGDGGCCAVPIYGLEDAVSFFIYNTTKIFILLFILIFTISIIKSFFPPEKAREIFKKTKSNRITGNLIGASLGVVTPFCTCSAVSIFIGFVESGAPLGATFSFLISSPMVNEIALTALFSMFGLKVALIYLATGIIIATLGGYIIGKLDVKQYVEEYVYQIKIGDIDIQKLTFRQRINDALIYVTQILKKIWLYVIIGMLIGSIMHGWIPQNVLSEYMSKNNPFAVLTAVAVGIPIYLNAAGVIPVVSELIRLGIPIGTALAFMMSVTALSLPEIIILRNVIKPKLLAMFVGIIGISIIIVGYLFNFII